MPYRPRSNTYLYLAVIILLLGFGGRVWFLFQSHPYVDEYFTILAAEMVQQRGFPLLPSGLFYSHGFLYTYLIALLGWPLKVTGPVDGMLQADMLYRVPNLLIGAMSMAVMFSMTRQWFGVRAAAVALSLMAVYPHGIVWGSRVRMYTLIFLVLPLLAYLFYRVVVLYPESKRWYALALLLLFLGLLIHNWLIIVVPALLLAGMVVGLGRGKPIIRSWRWWLPGLIVFVVSTVLSSRLESLWLATPESVPQDTGWQGMLAATLGRLNPSASLADSSSFLQEFFWTNPFNLIIMGLVLLGLPALIWLFKSRRSRRSGRFHRWPLLYLYLLLLTTCAEFFVLLEPELKQPRYAAPLLIIGFMILGGWSEIALTYLTFRPQKQVGQNSPGKVMAHPPAKLTNTLAYILLPLILVGFGLIAARQLPKIFFEGLPPVAYEKAFQYVTLNSKPGEAVLSPLPAAARLFLDKPGYFVAQNATYQFVHVNTQGILGDRWVGAPWLRTVEEFKNVLRSSTRTWLVADTFTLESQFHSDWKLVMRHNMANVWHEDGVLIFVGEGLSRDIPTEPDIPTEAILAGKLKLIGYSHTFQPGEMRLILFWQVLNDLAVDYTNFVHIRNQAGQNVAQVDVQPLAGEYPTSRWRVGETVIDEIVIPLPAELPSGTYRLLVGLYRWDTLERLPVVSDTSGENAIELEPLVVP